MSPEAIASMASRAPERSGRAVTLVAVLMATACVAFAAVNVYFEVSDQFGDGPYAAYASGISVVNWLVVGLKLVGAAVALLSVSPRPLVVPPLLLGVALWGVFSTLGLYSVGNLVQAAALAAGVTGPAEDVGLAGVGYVLGFLAAAAGFGVLAVSYSRRHRLPRRTTIIGGALGAPVTIGLVLVVVPALLVALGVMPGY